MIFVLSLKQTEGAYNIVNIKNPAKPDVSVLQNKIISDQQEGFRRGRSLLIQIFILKEVVEKWEVIQSVQPLFFTIKTPHDSVVENVFKTIKLRVPGN